MLLTLECKLQLYKYLRLSANVCVHYTLVCLVDLWDCQGYSHQNTSASHLCSVNTFSHLCYNIAHADEGHCSSSIFTCFHLGLLLFSSHPTCHCFHWLLWSRARNDSLQELGERKDLGSNPPHWSFLETTNCLAHRLALAATRLLLIPEDWSVNWHPQWHFLLPALQARHEVDWSQLVKWLVICSLMSWGLDPGGTTHCSHQVF